MAKKDFEKKKAKVGRAKPGAANRTDTSFVARRLVVREQAMSTAAKVDRALGASGREAASDETRLLAQLGPVLGQMGHHGAGQRASATQRAARVLKDYPPAAVGAAAGPVLSATCRVLLDRDADVRAAASGLLSALLAGMAPCAAGAFVARPLGPALLAGAAHVDPGVRTGILKALSVLAAPAGAAALGREGVASLAVLLVPAVVAAYPAGAGLASTPGIQGACDAVSALLSAYVSARSPTQMDAEDEVHVFDAQPEGDVRHVPLAFSLSLVRARPEGAVVSPPLRSPDMSSLFRWMAAVRLGLRDAAPSDGRALRVLFERVCAASDADVSSVLSSAALPPSHLRLLASTGRA